MLHRRTILGGLASTVSSVALAHTPKPPAPISGPEPAPPRPPVDIYRIIDQFVTFLRREQVPRDQWDFLIHLNASLLEDHPDLVPTVAHLAHARAEKRAFRRRCLNTVLYGQEYIDDPAFPRKNAVAAVAAELRDIVTRTAASGHECRFYLPISSYVVGRIGRSQSPGMHFLTIMDGEPSRWDGYPIIVNA